MTHQQTAQDASAAAVESEVGRGCSDAACVDLVRLRGRGCTHRGPVNNLAFCEKRHGPPCAGFFLPYDAYSATTTRFAPHTQASVNSPFERGRKNQTSSRFAAFFRTRPNHAERRCKTGRRPPAQSRELHARNTRPDAAGIPQACGEEPGGVACIADPGSEGNPALHPREEAGPPVAERSQGGKGHANNPSVPMKTVRYPDFNRLPSNFRPKSYPQARYD